MGRDAPTDPNAQAAYECHICGETTTSDTHPGACPDCGTTMRNRATPLE
ncbi:MULTISPECIES: rubrerythrin-like domain-containing protein [Halobacterium]|uniref:Small CPxCG-related zinc finger protein n=3 Tax=Halobacterium salinarum TaxID=2242 RepID=A0A510N423_HALSA|nr:MULTISPECIES: rubrerythrin-like domain-containing protein [Halobacterium]MCF2166086.1 rubrerythrin-like domain-containing protein [Halobacterium salinarum]MCF2166820.1 rubrerythrin-like domain-containing protein [Halobacterium salinarum]MCF2208571.1 rubrerythrin-like domain-containing protein [Halobacterium salinarum]MCF2237778.1 rubrerythrin-like domain-containing protein [Halobacterium salinarum]MDL0120241.1 rubrerythrin-like domain-containing protein [Halobacterium salinarum]